MKLESPVIVHHHATVNTEYKMGGVVTEADTQEKQNENEYAIAATPDLSC